MKVLLIIQSLGAGGAERQVSVIAPALAARGHDVGIVLLRGQGGFTDDAARHKVQIHHLKKRSRWDLVGPLWRLIRLFVRLRPDVVHGYLPVSNILAILLGVIRPGVRVCLGVRASNMELCRYDRLTRWTYALEARLAGFADLVIANAAANLSALRSRGGRFGAAAVIPNGIDTSVFLPDAQARAVLRARLGLEEKVVVGMVARRDPMKDHDTFLIAAKMMATVRPGLAFILAGTGVDLSDERLRLLAGAVPAPVHLLGNYPNPESLYPALDVFVLASFGEGFPNVLGEAMACGIPCVASAVGASAEIIGESGEIVPPSAPDALAEACLRLADRTRTSNLSLTVRERVVNEYSVAHLVERTEAAFAGLTDTRQSILHIISGLGRGGAEKTLVELAINSPSFRHEVVSLTSGGHWGPTLQAAGIVVHELGIRKNALSFIGGLFRLTALLRRAKPTLVQTWLYHADLLGCVAAWLAGKLPMIWTLRCSDMDRGRYGLITRILAAVSKVPHLVVANSDAGQRWHQAHGYKPRRWKVIPNGIDTATFRPDPASRARWREDLGVSGTTLVIGMAARRDPMKNHAGFLKSAALVAASLPDVAFAIAGTGTEDDLELRRLAADVAAPCHFLGNCGDMPGLLNALDIFVLPSLYGEGFPNVLAEAMACGTPCVTADVGDAAKVVGETGRVVPVGDDTALAMAIQAVATDQKLRSQFAATAQVRVQAEYDRQRTFESFDAIWNELVGNRAEVPAMLVGRN